MSSERHNINVRTFKKLIFLSIRVCLWVATFIACIPAPMEWLKGIVIEAGVDREMCAYYYGGDAIFICLYIINLIVWSLPFVRIRNMWNTLRIDLLSLCAAVLLLTSAYLVYAGLIT